MKPTYGCAMIVALAASLGCKGKPKDKAQEGATATTDAAATAKAPPADLFVYADVTIDQAPPPARFAAPLPTSLDDDDTDDRHRASLEAYVRARTCAGDPDVRARVLTSLRAQTADPDYAIADVDLEGVLGECDTPNEPWCAWLIAGATGTEQPAMRDLFAVALEMCPGPAAAAAATGKQISPAAVAKWRAATTESNPTEPSDDEPPARTRAELDRCVADPDEPAVVECLEQLVQVDRAAAAAAARTQVFADISWDEGRTVITALRRYPAAGALAQQLRDWKLIPATPPARGDDPQSLTAGELLDDSGATYGYLRVADEDSPEAHAVACFEATARVAELDGIVFEQTPAAGGSVDVIGYLGGKRYRAKAAAADVDPATLAGLLNTIARDRGATTRFLVLAAARRDEGYLAIGPEAGLTAAVAAELLH